MFDFFTQDQSAQLYECGFSCDNAWLLKIQKDCFFITDSRYTLEAQEFCSKNTQIIEESNITQGLIKLINSLKPKELIFDDQQVSVSVFNQISSLCNTSLKPKASFHQRLRIIKNQEEIQKIAQSQHLNQKAYEKFASFLLNQKNPLNEKELLFYAKNFLQDHGNYELSFEPIIGINANAAKPHALASTSLLNKEDLILFDAGIKFKHYCSDRTRTAIFDENFHFEKQQSFKDIKKQKVYDIVLKAQEETIKSIKSGMKGKEIDAIARNIIEEHGFGNFFNHSTGHGIGLDIHELPFISPRSEEIIEDGMVFSIEPGIYLPNEFGVRIEDLVVIKNGRAHIL
ncbi:MULTISPECIES: M24 family metallopeptidase [unclassified Helicobacter]|uniref:M24 family metallopeptidase n=1 Tax=unclassified Helicobacter TaxID=2593540 RepID=UPI000CF01F81|nr:MULTISPECIES: M24 family metallopeptidase [unclassified Helicobacter]